MEFLARCEAETSLKLMKLRLLHCICMRWLHRRLPDEVGQAGKNLPDSGTTVQ